MTEVQSGTKQSEVAKIYGVPRYTISIMLLPGNKEQTKSALQFDEVSTKGKNGRLSLKRNKQYFSREVV